MTTASSREEAGPITTLKVVEININQFGKYNVVNSEHCENNFCIVNFVYYKKVTIAVDKMAQQ